MNKPFKTAPILLAAALLAAASRLPAHTFRQDQKPTSDQAAFFESKVRPVLAANCFACHGAAVQKAGLRLDSFAGVRAGSAAGPVVAPYLPGQSRLIAAVRYNGAVKMPPGGKLRPADIAALAEWVKMGAPWPDAPSVKPEETGASSSPVRPRVKADRSFWSFQPVKRPALPKVKNTAWVKSPIDRFVLAGLEAKGLNPAPPADRRTLIRRAYFDLIGLPPTPEEVAAFYADRSPDAFAGVVDRLLASPQYGERWGRHWLDVARYADSNGLDENVAFANAYRYRDYVVAAFNKDKPYDQFIREQIAGDLIPAASDEERNERLIATGFLSLGAKVLAESDKEKMVMDIVDEQIEATSKAFMGLTVTCARCHDHKFDPIPTKDYYALAGIFKSTKSMSNLATVAMWNERQLIDPVSAEKQKEFDKRIAGARKRVQELKDSRAPADQLKMAEDAIKEIEKQAPSLPVAMAMDEGSVANCRVHIRGDTQKLGDEVPRGFLAVLQTDNCANPDARHSGRLELAEWLSNPAHPLAARVEVNRIWQGHFGEGLVRTPDNWGLLGEKPTHPELLDWLASEFVRGSSLDGINRIDKIGNSSQGKNPFSEAECSGSFIQNPVNPVDPVQKNTPWSVKRMHRMIMLSSAYQMSSANDAKALQVDPENRLLWRVNRRRLEAEPLRDAMLAVSGNLDLRMGGSLLDTGNHNYVTNDQSGNAARYQSSRRSIYLPVIRNALYDMFQAFDFGDPSMVNAKRGATTVAPQALFVMNSPFAIEQASDFAKRVLDRVGLSDSERIRRAFLRALSRSPSPDEITRALGFIQGYSRRLADAEKDPAKQRQKAWQALCQALLASNEFAYID